MVQFVFAKMSDPGLKLTPEMKEKIQEMLKSEAGKAIGDQVREKLKVIGAKMKEATSTEEKEKYIKEIQQTVSSSFSSLTNDLKMQAEKLEDVVKSVDIFAPNYMLFALAALLITLFLGL